MSLNKIETAQGLRIRSTQDFAAGLFMMILAGIALFMSRDLATGTLRQLGPGMLPKSFAVICAALGLLLSLNALRYKGEKLAGWSGRGVLFVLGAACLFGLTIRGFEIQGFAARAIGAILLGGTVSAVLSFIAPRENVLSAKIGETKAITLVFLAATLLMSYLLPTPILSAPPLGMLIAGPLVVFVSGLAAEDVKLKELTIFAIAMTIACALLFKYALSLPIPLAPWLFGI